jgi:pyruvate kinase
LKSRRRWILDEILEASDGVMVARGDLGVELALARVPGAQKTIIERARFRGKFVITATQMLESMIQKPTPTRAEVNDVANAIFDGTDAVMLSAETATGQYPLEAVRMMASIANKAECFLSHRPFPEPPLGNQPTHAEIIAEAAYHSGLSASVKAIAVFTTSGETARLIARFRPRVPIFAFCETDTAARQLSVIYGSHAVAPIRVKSVDEMLEVCDLNLLGEAWSRISDSVILVAGAPFGMAGSANLIKLHHVGQVGFQESLE